MRVFLLAAGLGTRLRPLTYAKPKALMPVANRPSIVRLLDLLKPYAIKETFINLHAFPEEIKDEIGGGSWWNMKVHYSYEPELMGTAGAIKKIGMFLADDRFILVNADIVTDFDIRNAIDFHDKSGARATLIMAEPRSKYSDQLISVGEDGRVLIEKSKMDRVKSGIYTGIGIFEPSVIK
ncbi:MAG: nucleotidyltransferase family protein, partial [Actinomycetota bacterium]|nr:nucleotidyltransferase family protein [Actinomycetota bacterium]